MTTKTPEELSLDVISACAECELCRELMEESCQFFPELFRLFDAQKYEGKAASPRELRSMLELCNYCALCPCANIRADILQAKTAFMERDGIKPSVRLLEDVERMGRICGAFPALTNRLFQGGLSGGLLKKAMGIHPERKMPTMPAENFDAWAEAKGLTEKLENGAACKVAYFAGCTARFLFPEVPRAVVQVLEHNGIEVYYPPQNCCGMPTLLEGDRAKTLELAQRNLAELSALVEQGYDLLCSCPTCGYFFKHILAQDAYYSDAYQATVGGDKKFFKIPSNPRERNRDESGYIRMHRLLHKGKDSDDGYFADLDPVARVLLSERVYDLGEYLLMLHEAGVLTLPENGPDQSMTYFPPCHQREQDIGAPFLELLGLLPGGKPDHLSDAYYCCGLAGIMGFKKDFHASSLEMSKGLAKKIEQLAPELLVTDCLSCRLQLNQITTREVRHPIELLARAYGLGEGG
jgi:glycerol-3-phosphate dehydrogenase subunit C